MRGDQGVRQKPAGVTPRACGIAGDAPRVELIQDRRGVELLGERHKRLELITLDDLPCGVAGITEQDSREALRKDAAPQILNRHLVVILL